MRHEIKRLRQSVGRPAWLALVVLVGALVLWALAVSPVLALPADQFAGSFGSKGTAGGQFKEPVGVAVNDSTEPGAVAAGDIYVVDRGDNRVERFSSTGSYLGKFNGSGSFEVEGKAESGSAAPTGQLSSPAQIAVDDSGKTVLEDPSVGDVYVADAGHGVIDKFSSTGAYLRQITAASVGTPFAENELLGLAVDSTGDLWIYERAFNGRVYKVTDDGSLVREFTTSRGNGVSIGEQPLTGIVVDSNEDVYVNCCSREVLKLNSTGEELADFSIGDTAVLALDTSTNALYVDKVSSIEQYGPFGEPYASPLQTFGAEGPESLAESSGIAVNAASGAIYASEREADKVEIFKPASVSIEAASEVEKRPGGTAVATLNGSVNPENVALTACRFEYGTSAAYGQTAECSELPGSGGVAVAVQAAVSGLQQNATYDYRLVAENGEGQLSVSQNETFQTPPAVDGVQTGAASNVGQAGATLNGSLLPGGAVVTACEFEYGIESPSEHSVACAQLPGAGVKPVEVDAGIEGLQSNAFYHYRLSVTNEYGTSTASDQLFRTTLTRATVTDRAAFAADVSQFAATLRGTINPGNATTSYHFVYGPTSAYGSSIPVPEGFTPSNDEDDAVSEQLAGLQAGTTYHFALIATNGAGTVTGPDETFTTAAVPAPLVSTGGASGVTRGEALLSGTIDPQGWATTYHFDYGTTTAYGSSWPTVDVSLGAFTGDQNVAVALQNLAPGTTYHYRLVASNPGGAGYGPDETFTTGEYPTSAIQEAPVLNMPGFVFPPANEGSKVVKTVKHKQAARRGKRKRKTPRKRARKAARNVKVANR
jgi:hypothetical protein